MRSVSAATLCWSSEGSGWIDGWGWDSGLDRMSGLNGLEFDMRLYGLDRSHE